MNRIIERFGRSNSPGTEGVCKRTEYGEARVEEFGKLDLPEKIGNCSGKIHQPRTKTAMRGI